MTSLRVLELGGADRERASALPFAVLPIGSVEYHGAHAAFGTDTTLADGFAARLAAVRPCLLFPSIAYTFVPRLTRSFGPAVSVAPGVFLAYLTEVLHGVVAFGPRRVLVLNGHSENQHALRLAAEALHEAEADVSVLIVNWWKLVAPTPAEAPAGWGAGEGGGHGHGGPLEISVTAAFEGSGVDVHAEPAADVAYEAPWWRHAAQVVGRGQRPAGFAGYHGRVSAIDVARGERIVDQVTAELARLVDGWLARADAEPHAAAADAHADADARTGSV